MNYKIDYDIFYVPVYYNNGLVGVQVNIIQHKIQTYQYIDSSIYTSPGTSLEIYEERIPIYSKVLD